MFVAGSEHLWRRHRSRGQRSPPGRRSCSSAWTASHQWRRETGRRRGRVRSTQRPTMEPRGAESRESAHRAANHEATPPEAGRRLVLVKGKTGEPNPSATNTQLETRNPKSSVCFQGGGFENLKLTGPGGMFGRFSCSRAELNAFEATFL